MLNNDFSKAYTEVLEILKYLPKNEYDKIPKEKIEFFENNKDNSYNFVINPEKPLENQNISIEANSIIVILFRDYFATEKQKEKLDIILKQNEDKYQAELRNKYNADDIFKKRKVSKQTFEEKEVTNNLPVKSKNKTFFSKFILYIKSILKL